MWPIACAAGSLLLSVALVIGALWACAYWHLPTVATCAMLAIAVVGGTRTTGWASCGTVIVSAAAALSASSAGGAISNVDAVIMLGMTVVLAIAANPKIWALRGPYGLHLSTGNVVLHSLLAAVPVVLLDHRGRIRRASTGSEGLFGLPKDELCGMNFSDVVPDFSIRAHGASRKHPGIVPPEGPHWLVHRHDKTTSPVELWLEHTPQGAIVRLTDLGPRHAADAQARELHSQLNKVWRLNSLGEMAATLAHELNQPLGAAASYLHAAQEDMKRAGPMGESAWRTADLAKAQMLRAGQIIRRMRELLTMEMRTLSTERVRRVVEDVLPILNLTGQEKQVQISVDIDSPDAVRLDRIQFQQALVNLVRNAVEASPSNSKVLITGRVLSAQSYEIAVEDSGPGIAPDQVESVFTPMTTTKSGGMGLGLSVTRTIVESHGGNLRVGTSRWGGARFSFNLSTDSSGSDE